MEFHETFLKTFYQQIHNINYVKRWKKLVYQILRKMGSSNTQISFIIIRIQYAIFKHIRPVPRGRYFCPWRPLFQKRWNLFMFCSLLDNNCQRQKLALVLSVYSAIFKIIAIAIPKTYCILQFLQYSLLHCKSGFKLHISWR